MIFVAELCFLDRAVDFVLALCSFIHRAALFTQAQRTTNSQCGTTKKMSNRKKDGGATNKTTGPPKAHTKHREAATNVAEPQQKTSKPQKHCSICSYTAP